MEKFVAREKLGINVIEFNNFFIEKIKFSLDLLLRFSYTNIC